MIWPNGILLTCFAILNLTSFSAVHLVGSSCLCINIDILISDYYFEYHSSFTFSSCFLLLFTNDAIKSPAITAIII